MKKLMSILLAVCFLFAISIPVSATSQDAEEVFVVSEEIRDIPTGDFNIVKQEIITVYSDGSKEVGELTVTYANRMLRANSGTAYTDYTAEIKSASNVLTCTIKMEATFTYDGAANTVSCTHKSFTATGHNGFKVTKKAMNAKTSGTLTKKCTVTAPVSIVSDALPQTRSATISCTSKGEVKKNHN